MNKDIDNKNNKGQYHGYQVWYDSYNKLWHRGNWKNSEEIKYQENHLFKLTLYFIK